jgi:hypothetical protein
MLGIVVIVVVWSVDDDGGSSAFEVPCCCLRMKWNYGTPSWKHVSTMPFHQFENIPTGFVLVFMPV